MSEVDVVGTGFTVLDRVYAGSPGLEAEELGGSCGNVLISLAMLQRKVAPILSLGEDEVGIRLVAAFHHAGAETRYIRRRLDVRSPILAQHLNVMSGLHTFAFKCPETHVDLPRYASIDGEDVERARPAIRNCSVFYTDRLSAAIVDAMEMAAEAGSVVFFEPSEVGDEQLLRRAVVLSTVAKFAPDRLATLAERQPPAETTIVVVTHGDAGLEVRRGAERLWCRPHSATKVRDTYGSGDMVSVGIIDWMLDRPRMAAGGVAMSEFAEGVEAGQRLAAENCAYVGVRGLFRERGADYARSVLRR